jgi:hypothetical protein
MAVSGKQLQFVVFAATKAERRESRLEAEAGTSGLAVRLFIVRHRAKGIEHGVKVTY